MNDKTFTVKLKMTLVDLVIVIIKVYILITDHDEDDRMYEQTEDILREDSKGKTNCIIIGEWNSIVGEIGVRIL